MSGTCNNLGISVWAADGLASATASDAADPLNLYLNTTAGSIVVAVGFARAGISQRPGPAWMHWPTPAADVLAKLLTVDRAGLGVNADTLDGTQPPAFGLDLIDSADASAARSTLGLGTAATQTVGTSASNVVQLDGSAKLPAVDGSQLTNIASGLKLLTSGTVSSAATLESCRRATSAVAGSFSC